MQQRTTRVNPSEETIKIGPFYESDCQGRTPSSLIAERFLPGQSAPAAWATRPCGASGSATQSASASFSSLELPIPLDGCQR